jgi:hypothetical protein
VDKYRTERANAQAGELGVMSAAHCAAALVDTVLSPERSSGVYLIGIEGGIRPFIKTVAFDSLDRNRLFLSLATEVSLPDGVIM